MSFSKKKSAYLLIFIALFDPFLSLEACYLPLIANRRLFSEEVVVLVLLADFLVLTVLLATFSNHIIDLSESFSYCLMSVIWPQK